MIDPRKPLSFLLVAVLAAVLRAQDVISFPQHQLTGIVDFDVDGDGLKDSIDVDYSVIVVRPGHGNGTFGDEKLLLPGQINTAIAGDVTGDGVADVIAVSSFSTEKTLVVLPGTGAWFGAPVETPTSYDIQAVHQRLADMNGDGLADWVAASSLVAFDGPTAIEVALSGGDGTFNVLAPTAVPGWTSGFALGDFDGNGTLDVASADINGTSVNVRLGAGDGSLAASSIDTSLPPDVTQALGAFDPNLAAQDLDGDGLCDLAFGIEITPVGGSSFEDLVGVLYADGSGRFTPGSGFTIPYSGPLMLGDTNADGAQDLVVVGSNGPDGTGLATFLGDGAGGFVAPILSGAVGEQFLFDSSLGPELTDVDGDGVLDADLVDAFVSGRGDGTFVGGTHLTVGANGPKDVGIADMNGDGKQDFVVARKKKAQSFVVLLGNGQGGFEQHDPAAPSADQLALGDLDGDGDVDIVATDTNAGAQTATRLNDGSGLSFAPPAQALSFTGLELLLGDVDGDGALDLLTSKAGQKDLLLLRGNGQGGFLAQQTLSTGNVAAEYQLVDLDGDGTADVVSRTAGQSELTVLSGTGTGAFGAPQDVPVPVVPDCFTVADLNRDGLPDLAVGFSDPYGNGLHLLLAQAPGVFGHISPPDTYNVEQLRAADVDRDGWPDLVAIRAGYLLQVFRNLGDGTVDEPQSSMIVDNNANLELSDVNGDGFTDAVVWETASQTLVVLPNLLSAFPNLGHQHGTSFGTPHLVTTGAPLPDEKVSFTATGTPLQSLGALFLGLEFAPTPFAGGTLVPSPDVMLPVRAGVPLAGRWPDLPSGTTVYAQAWFASGAEVAATNAIEAITP